MSHVFTARTPGEPVCGVCARLLKFHAEPSDRPFIPAELKIKAAKEFGKLQGHTGNHGGWIHGPNGTIAQGWFSYFGVRQVKILDHYTRALTAFDSFAELLATDERYSPTIRPRTWRERFLADAFDRAAYDRKQSRRVWRGSEARA